MKALTLAILLALGVLPSTPSRVDYTAAGGTQFTFSFKTFSASHVKVYKDGALQNTGYAVSLNGNQDSSPGGTVTFTTAPTAGVVVRIERVVPVTNESVWTSFSRAKSLEYDLDRSAMRDQQLARDLTDHTAHESIVAAAASGETLVTATGGSASRKLKDRFADMVNVLDYGAVGDGVTDSSSAFTTAAAAAAATNKPLYVPGGTYRLASRPTLALNGLVIQGAGFANTILFCDYAGTGISLDAFAGGGPSDPFITVDLLDLTVKGNAATTSVILAQGIHRSTWRVRAIEAEPTAGVAVRLQGCMSNHLTIQSSVDVTPMTSPPYAGIRMEAGTRAGVSVGNSTNNTIIPQIDGLTVGLFLVNADLTVFQGGYSQSNSTYGAVVGSGCRFNTFLGTAFENAAATADFADGGESTRFINNYSSKAALLQGRSAVIDGGFYERVVVDTGARRNRVQDVRLNYWRLGSGGFHDSGTETESSNLLGTTFTASFATTVMTVSVVAQGILDVGQTVYVTDGAGSTVSTTITALGTGTGGSGTYLLAGALGTLTSRTASSSGYIPDSKKAKVSADRGDTSQTLRVGIDAPTQRWATTLTANRTVTLSTVEAKSGDTFRVVRTGLGAFTLDVGGLKTIASGTAAFVDVAFNGSAWVLTGYGAL